MVFVSYPERPDVECIPAAVSVAPDRPKSGAWFWYFSFREQRLVNGKLAAWDKNCGRARRVLRVHAHFDYADDPVTDMHRFVSSLSRGGWDWYALDTCGEGDEFRIEYWKVSKTFLHVCVESSIPWYGTASADGTQHFLVNCENFYRQILKGYCAFGKSGGMWWPLDQRKKR